MLFRIQILSAGSFVALSSISDGCLMMTEMSELDRVIQKMCSKMMTLFSCLYFLFFHDTVYSDTFCLRYSLILKVCDELDIYYI